MKEKKHWNRRVLSFFLALAMVITQLGVWNAGKESVQAAENSSFTLYYYNESKGAVVCEYMELGWNFICRRCRSDF